MVAFVKFSNWLTPFAKAFVHETKEISRLVTGLI
jgi:hypothetical protein